MYTRIPAAFGILCHCFGEGTAPSSNTAWCVGSLQEALQLSMDETFLYHDRCWDIRIPSTFYRQIWCIWSKFVTNTSCRLALMLFPDCQMSPIWKPSKGIYSPTWLFWLNASYLIDYKSFIQMFSGFPVLGGVRITQLIPIDIIKTRWWRTAISPQRTLYRVSPFLYLNAKARANWNHLCIFLIKVFVADYYSLFYIRFQTMRTLNHKLFLQFSIISQCWETNSPNLLFR